MSTFQEISGDLVRTVEEIKVKRNNLRQEMKEENEEVAKI